MADASGSATRTLASRTRSIDPVDAAAILSALNPPHVYWSAPGEPTVAGMGVAATVAANGEDRWDAIREGVDDLFGSLGGTEPRPARPRLFGGFAFHDGHEPAHPWLGFPDAYFLLPEVQVVVDGDDAWVTVNEVTDDPDGSGLDDRLDRVVDRIESLPQERGPTSPPGVTNRTRIPSREEWRRKVQSATDRIEAGDLRKVVLAQSTELELADELSVPDALSRLAPTYPDSVHFLVRPNTEATFFGVTPERLVSLSGRSVETTALAGSTGRGDTDEEDEWLAAELRNSEKDIHEHELVAEAIRDQLSPLASSVRTGQRRIRKLATVQHLETPIAAELADAGHVLSLVEALHPTPAVGGLPPERALETIRSTEAFDRGWYAAPVGWIDAAGDGTFAVAIRSAVANGTSATLFAGAGIVADSEPDREWDEVQLKYGPMLEALE